MYSIAICDDDKLFAELLSRRISSFFSNLSSSITIQIFTDPQVLLSSAITYDLYFIDIRMPKVNGLEIAKILRSEPATNDSSIVFVSSIHDVVFDSIKYSPLRYIRKEFLDHELPETLFAFLSLKKEQKPETVLEVKENRQTISIKLSELSVVEAYGHYVNFYCNYKTYHTRAKLSDFESVLLSNSFECARRGCFVNLAHVHLLTKDSVIMTNGEDIPISRSCRENFQTAYLKWEREQHHVFTI